MIPVSEIKAGLASDAAAFSEHLLGKATGRAKDELRFGKHQSLAVQTAGPKIGLWCSHESGNGGDMIDLICHVRGCDLKTAITVGAGWLGMSDHERERAAPAMSAQKAESRPAVVDHFPAAMRCWAERKPLAGSPGETYLNVRGSSVPVYADDLGFHPACIRGTERLPAMIALMRNPLTGQPCGIHRTYLRSDGSGKAEGQAKMMLGNAGVIHLSDPFEVLHRIGICEGIETGLALIQHGGWEPIWAAGSAGGIRAFPVLAYNDIHLTVFADNDDSGASLKAARECAQRWADAGRTAAIKIPPQGQDWLNVAQQVAT